MHNLYANIVKILEIFKDFSKDLVNERGNLQIGNNYIKQWMN